MQDDIAPLVWKVMDGTPLTTGEVIGRLDDQFRHRCPDDMAKALNRLRRRGLIKGEVSADAGGWVWWTDAECLARRDG
ncbi:MAG: hypothetical protein GXX87_01035 [Euryarchaeota archaeon]|jgi:hypothetical protein|nr:hypothetical protein [Euryarchaeota archaeon]